MPAQGSEEKMMEGSKKLSAERISRSLSAGLIIRQKKPTNLEMPFNHVDSYLTPTDLFYVRTGMPEANRRVRPLG
jgi:hypothetical protein